MKGFFIENIDDFADSTVSFLLLYRKSYQLVELGGSCKKESCLTFGTKTTHPPQSKLNYKYLKIDTIKKSEHFFVIE